MAIIIVIALGVSIIQAANVTIDGSIEYQTIEGLGCQMESHPQYQNDTAFWDMFFNDVGVSVVRTGTATDTGLASFTAPIMSTEVWPTYRWAKRYGQRYVSGYAHPRIPWKDCPYKSGGTLLPEYYDDFSYYLLDVYKIFEDSTGMTVNSVAPFAEPDLNTPCDSTGLYSRSNMSLSQYLAFLKVYGPIVKAARPDIKINVGLSWNVQNSIYYANLILADTSVRRWVGGVSANGYGTELGVTTPQYWKGLADLARQYNITDISVPEVSHCCSNKPFDSTGMVMAGWIHDALAIGNANLWYMTLGIDKGKYNSAYYVGLVYSKNWPCPGGVCEYSSNGITKDGYAFRQFAHWVRPGAIRIEAISSDTNEVKASAYWHPADSAFTLVAINPATSDKTVDFSIANLGGLSTLNAVRTSRNESGVDLGEFGVVGNSFSYILPSRSITTFAGTLAGGTAAWKNVQTGASLEVFAIPNPFTATTTLTFSGSYQHSNLSIFDINGKLVRCIKDLTSKQVVFSSEGLAAGIYILKLRMGTGQYTKRLYLQK